MKKVVACLSLCLGACTSFGPDYQIPATAVVQQPVAQQPFMTTTPATVADEAKTEWWRLYDSSELNRLVELALHANTDIRVARANLARSEALLAAIEGRDEVHVGASAEVARAQVAGEAYLLEKKVPVFNLANAGMFAGYSVDWAGETRRGIEAGQAELEATQAMLHNVQIHVVADTVLAYLDICAANGEAQDASEWLRVRQRQLAAMRTLVAQGRKMPIEIPRAEHQVAQVQAMLPAFQARQQVGVQRLAVLTGQAPAAWSARAVQCQGLPQLTRPIPVGDGRALLKRRPDIRVAERQLAADTARIGIATAALYPHISFGVSSGVTGIAEHAGNAPTQRWSVGSLISWTWPGNEEKARVHQADAKAQASLAQFDKVVLQALQETEGALTHYARDLVRDSALLTAQQHAQQVLRQQTTLFRQGRVSSLEVLDAELTQASAALNRRVSQTQLAVDQVQLFLALGGGWQ